MSDHNLQTSCYVAAAELTFTLTYRKKVIFQQSSQASSQEIPGFVFFFFNVFMSLQLFKNLRDNILYFIDVLSENTWKQSWQQMYIKVFQCRLSSDVRTRPLGLSVCLSVGCSVLVCGLTGRGRTGCSIFSQSFLNLCVPSKMEQFKV